MTSSMRPPEVAQRLRTAPQEVFLLDVREDDERETARIEPSLHIPMRSVPERLAEIPKDRTVVVYCHMGGRSEMIVGFLSSRGYSNVANLEGGIDAWSRTVDPSIPRY